MKKVVCDILKSQPLVYKFKNSPQFYCLTIDYVVHSVHTKKRALAAFYITHTIMLFVCMNAA